MQRVVTGRPGEHTSAAGAPCHYEGAICDQPAAGRSFLADARLAKSLLGCGWRLDCPFGVGAGGMVDKEDPGAIRQLSMHLHAVMMHFGGLPSLSSPRISHCERVIAKSPAMVV